MPSFSNRSERRLSMLCTELSAVAHDSIKVIDFSVIETARTRDTQERYFNEGVSRLRWPESKHNVCEDRPRAEAMDLWPYIPEFGALSGHPRQITAIAGDTGRSEAEVKEFIYKAFARLAGVVQACAAARGYSVRWGGDWDGDGSMLDQNFHDLPHFELVR